MMSEQQTIGSMFQFEGVGIHTGTMARVIVYPAPPGTGRVFQIGGESLPAQVQFVIDTRRSTTLGREGVKLSTVEHLLSALAGCGIDNCTMVVEGPEIPILDGSARPHVEAIRAAGIVGQGVPARFIHLSEPVTVNAGGSELRAEPADCLSVQVTTEFDEWSGGLATVSIEGPEGVPVDYANTIAPARTFAFRREVEMLIAAGLAKGGSLDNALIIDPPDTLSSPLRVPFEWCAHKMLDAIGDLALLDARLAMKISARRPGHGSNTALARAIFAQNHE